MGASRSSWVCGGWREGGWLKRAAAVAGGTAWHPSEREWVTGGAPSHQHGRAGP
jgi:hypothetical protein